MIYNSLLRMDMLVKCKSSIQISEIIRRVEARGMCVKKKGRINENRTAILTHTRARARYLLGKKFFI